MLTDVLTFAGEYFHIFFFQTVNYYFFFSKDRRYRFVKYKNCFIGSEAVEWLCNGVPDLKRDRNMAVKLGRGE